MIADPSFAERSVVAFGSTTIAYAVRRSARRRTVSVAVENDRRVVVTAPAGAARDRLDRIVRVKASWILERLRRRSDLPPPPPLRELVSGESYAYLGAQYRLRLERGVPVAPMRLLDGRLHLAVPRDLAAAKEPAYARAALLDWYLARARALLPARTLRWARRIGVEPSRVLVMSASKRWGSAAKDGTVRLNWIIVQAPRSLIDYVIAHELVHLEHPHHGAAFWSALGRVMPDYEARKARLRLAGPRLMW